MNCNTTHYRANSSSVPGDPTVSYSFPGHTGSWSTQAPYGGYGPSFGGGEPWGAFAPLTATQQSAFRAALQSWADVAAISFKQSEDSRQQVGDIRIAVTDLPFDEAAHAYYPSASPAAGDIWLNLYDRSNAAPTPGSYGFATLVHELGHALGLKHSFEDGAVLPAAADSLQYSLMSYTGHPTALIEPAGPMLYDIAAIQYLYGPNTSFHSGDDSYRFKPGVEHLRSLWDAGGIDSIDLSDHSRAAVVDLNPGAFSSIGIRGGGSAAKNNVSIAFGATIENAIGGSGDDRLIGNAVANSLSGGSGKDSLSGNAGNDSLDGGPGSDSLAGGAGNDSYVVADAGDLVAEGVGQGIDSVRTALSYGLPANLEQLLLLGAGAVQGIGNALANALTGNAGANRLEGGGGGDTLAGGAGADTLLGGPGDDSYQLDVPADLVGEAAAAGQDAVSAPFSYVLPANLEALVLAGGGSVNGVGNGLNNSLTGNAAANLLNGMAGADTMRGGPGNDRYEVDAAGDLVVEAADGGSDLVRSSVSYTLGAHLERLVLLGGAANGAGNALANSLTGNAGNNLLDGGAGADTLAGGAGNDQYRVDSAADLVVEAAADGLDTVLSTVSLSLAANLERLTLLGTAAIAATGNALGNLLTGNGAANRLDGAGGADTMAGGGGDDVYVVDSAGDVVSEGTGAGTDTVQSWRSHALAANLENLVLLGTLGVNGAGNAAPNALKGNGAGNRLSGLDGDDALRGGAGADSLAGGGGDDSLSGGKGADTLLGGEGADRLAGGQAADHFVFDALGHGVDIVSDFETGLGGDVLELGGLLRGFLAGSSDAAGFISLADAGSDTSLRVDADGGADGFRELCLLQGVGGLSVAGLLAAGNLDLLA